MILIRDTNNRNKNYVELDESHLGHLGDGYEILNVHDATLGYAYGRFSRGSERFERVTYEIDFVAIDSRFFALEQLNVVRRARYIDLKAGEIKLKRVFFFFLLFKNCLASTYMSVADESECAESQELSLGRDDDLDHFVWAVDFGQSFF